MSGWRDDKQFEIIEYPFNFNRYMEKQIKSIDDLNEREIAKEALLNGVGKAVCETEAKYQALERRICEGLEPRSRQYEIATTIIRRADYGAADLTLFPVTEIDLQEEELEKEWSTGEECYLGTVFLRITEEELLHFKNGRELSALWRHGSGQEPFAVRVRQAERYRHEIERLYQTFRDNRIPWETVHTGFLERFFDVFIQRKFLPIQGLICRKRERVSLSGLDIGWEEAGGRVEYGMLPLWNIQRLSVDGGLSDEAAEGVFCEHEISVKGRGETDGYLIEGHKDKLLLFRQGAPGRSPYCREGFLSNRRGDSFLGRLSSYNHLGSRLITRDGLFSRIMDLDIGEYIEVINYEIMEGEPAVPVPEGMNWFIKENLVPEAVRRTLLLRFKALKPDHYLTGSMIKFAVSALQLELIEFRLMGVSV